MSNSDGNNNGRSRKSKIAVSPEIPPGRELPLSFRRAAPPILCAWSQAAPRRNWRRRWESATAFFDRRRSKPTTPRDTLFDRHA